MKIFELSVHILLRMHILHIIKTEYIHKTIGVPATEKDTTVHCDVGKEEETLNIKQLIIIVLEIRRNRNIM